MKLISERKLIIGLRNGHYDSYKVLFDEYFENFVVFADKFLRDRSASEDLVQEAFTKLYINRSCLDEGKSLGSYLYVIVKRLILNSLRDAKNSKRTKIQQPVDEAYPFLQGFDTKLEYEELYRIVAEAIESMPPQRREVFILSRVRNMANKDIADLLNLSVRTVEKHLSLGLSDIRSAIEND